VSCAINPPSPPLREQILTNRSTDSFGGFASKYIKGRFFMDVHPPLAKMLIALTGYLAGFDGEFDFKEIGKDYLEPGVPYVAMRMLPALCGILLAPLIFLTLKAVGCRTTTAAMGSGLIIFGKSDASWSAALSCRSANVPPQRTAFSPRPG
jgi:dolichyl-phosphate-mannose--protein O-mannosyl transferase